MLHAAQQGGAASQMLLQGQTLDGISTGSHHHACEALRFSTAGPVCVMLHSQRQLQGQAGRIPPIMRSATIARAKPDLPLG